MTLNTKDFEPLFDPNRGDRFRGKSVEWFKEYGTLMAESTAFKVVSNCRGLIGTITELQKTDYWKQINPDWNEFCLETFHMSAEAIEAVAQVVRVQCLNVGGQS
tara:strand:- start:1038 stop:1349 length:312 start_codon:yes stop_codon:yes gene_type:complete